MKKFLGIMLVMLHMIAFAGPAGAVTIFSDDFNRSDSYTVGNSWIEIEDGNRDVAVNNNKLRLRDDRSDGPPDAAVTQTLSLADYSDIWLDFVWAATSDTENNDYLYVGWDLNDGNWTTVWSQALNGSTGFSEVDPIHLEGADYQADFRLRFWTDVSYKSEAAFIDNVVLSGDLDGGIAPVPEPATILLVGIGLLGLGSAGRKMTRK